MSIGWQCQRKKQSSITLSGTSNNLLCLSDQLKIWTSKFTVRDGNLLIDAMVQANVGQKLVKSNILQIF